MRPRKAVFHWMAFVLLPDIIGDTKQLPNIAQTLLCEHYRCHPKIINFCNQKFYRGELIIMTEDKGEKAL